MRGNGGEGQVLPQERLTGGIDVELQRPHEELVQAGQHVDEAARVDDADVGDGDVGHGGHAEEGRGDGGGGQEVGL